MDRRQFLASASAAASLALAGCTGGQDDQPSTTTEPTDTTTPPTTTNTTTDDGPLAVGEEASLGGESAMTVVDADASAFVVSRDGAERVVHAGNTTRYVHVTFEVDDVDDYETFVTENVTLQVNDQSFTDPVFPLGGGLNQFTAAYPVPNDVTPFTGSVVLDTGDTTATWEFDARAVEAITQTVDFAVTDVMVPSTVSRGEDFTAKLAVDNDGDPMTFVAKAHGTSGAPVREQFEVPGSDETSLGWELTAPDPDDDASEFEIQFDWGADTATRTVAFE